jgi:Ca2+-binding EF-hand superfamily protein
VNSADINEDGIIKRSELNRAARKQPHQPRTEALLTMIDPAEAMEASLDSDRLQALQSAPAFMTLRVDFHSQGDAKSSLQLVGLNSPSRESDPETTVGNSVITIDEGRQYIEISAAESASPAAQSAEPEQFAIGAVVDGYPLFRLLDTNGDKQITIQEARELPALLEQIDRNRDGSIDADEIPPAIRLAVSRGRLVNRLLAEASTAAKVRVAPKSPQAPNWFVPMDANRDEYLSRQEFSGTAEQFDELDQDKDGLVSVTEALHFEKSK